MYSASVAKRKGRDTIRKEYNLSFEDKKVEYNGILSGNILLIGQSGSGKTRFIRNVIVNKLVRAKICYWFSCMKLKNDVVKDYKDNFKMKDIYFYQISSVAELDDVLQHLVTSLTDTYNENNEGQNNEEVIFVFDDLIGIADRSSVYHRFLTTCRHFNVTSFSSFQTFKDSVSWDTIKGNSQIMICFKVGTMTHRVISSLSNLLNIHGTQKKKLWIRKLYIDLISNSSKFNHLFVDLRAESNYSPVSFRSNADNPYSQLCFYDDGSHERYNTYASTRIKIPGKKVFVISSVVRPGSIQHGNGLDGTDSEDESDTDHVSENAYKRSIDKLDSSQYAETTEEEGSSEEYEQDDESYSRRKKKAKRRRGARKMDSKKTNVKKYKRLRLRSPSPEPELFEPRTNERSNQSGYSTPILLEH